MSDATDRTSAARMRRLRERRRDGVHIVMIEVSDEYEIEPLIKHGYLDARDRDDPDALGAAVYTAVATEIGRLEGRVSE